ncbi:YceI family protein [Pseudomonas panipatensis]|uniref:Polyisoprenoid-binding protein YceI n=1 Tax=Pseudomonas panipatensis TaxID=428992 RepID=A0A1G8FU63_9PSED|nr:YceI family protein [Pseudomonas panipatensis]SDH85650.1 Polyisoprenoid-binding protein YceI [Pseudomonas panipatensis]SMP52282.1 Polyisoprenoid-binding protein YceI [Pseudomonas panipatensis]
MNALSKLTSALVIAGAAAVSATSALAAPETYTVDSTHTFERFSYSHFGMSTQLSRFNKTTGTVVVDKAAKTAKVDIVIDTTSVDTGYDTFNGHIQGADFLDTAKFPTATFKSTKVRFDGDKPVAIDGDLTIKGVTKPVTLTVTNFVNMPHPMLKKDAIGADAHVVIKRSDFGAGKYAPNVGDDVTISVSLEAIKS